MNSLMFRFAIFLFLVICSGSARAGIGADMPWTTYEAEDMKTTGTILGPKYAPFLVETESSGQKCVKLVDAGEYVEFTAQSPANAMVVRYSLPDAPGGGGINSTLSLYQNGHLVKSFRSRPNIRGCMADIHFRTNPARANREIFTTNFA